MDQLKSVGIVLFNEVEVLDFAGPYEVFSLAQASREGGKAFRVKTVSQHGIMIAACGGLKVQPDCSFETAPKFDILIVPGGYGARVIEARNEAMIEWLIARRLDAQIVASVCTGAFVLAAAGLLDGCAATTHWQHLDELEQAYPSVSVKRGVRFVDEGLIVTSAGVSAGIDMALHIVERVLSKGAAVGTAKGMEYDYRG